MATAAREPALKRQEIEEHKHAVEQRRDRVVDDVKELTDFKSRLRKEGPRIAAVGGALVVLVAGSLVLRAVLRRRGRQDEGLQSGGEPSLADLIAEVRALREEMNKQRKPGGGGLAGKVAVAAVSAAATSAGKRVADRIIERQEVTVAA